jgi:hypothetical protein
VVGIDVVAHILVSQIANDAFEAKLAGETLLHSDALDTIFEALAARD